MADSPVNTGDRRGIIIRVSGVRVPPPALRKSWKTRRIWMRVWNRGSSVTYLRYLNCRHLCRSRRLAGAHRCRFRSDQAKHESRSRRDAAPSERFRRGRGVARSTTTKQNGEDSDSSEDSRPPEPEEDNVEALALDADDSWDERDAEAAASAYITTRREVDP